MQPRLIDSGEDRVKLRAMDLDDILPKRPNDPLVMLARQDLDPLSVEELQARIAVLEAEIARSKQKMDRAVNHRASADQLFKR
jgi:uncharacterized small protein (DUF1192 family)